MSQHFFLIYQPHQEAGNPECCENTLGVFPDKTAENAKTIAQVSKAVVVLAEGGSTGGQDLMGTDCGPEWDVSVAVAALSIRR